MNTKGSTRRLCSGRWQVAVAACFLLTLAAGPSAYGKPPASAQIVDPVGDANVASNELDDETDTRPASLNEADLVGVWFDTLYRTMQVRDATGRVTRVEHRPTALRMHVETAAPAVSSGPTLYFESVIKRGTCSVGFAFIVHGPLSGTSPTPAEGGRVVSHGTGCPGPVGLRPMIFEMTRQGDRTVVVFPFEELAFPDGGRYVGPGDEVKASASFPSAFSRVWRPQGPEWPETNHGLIDSAYSMSAFTIAEDVPPDVDCTADPQHPDCH